MKRLILDIPSTIISVLKRTRRPAVLVIGAETPMPDVINEDFDRQTGATFVFFSPFLWMSYIFLRP